jgi:hypothetical protein
MEYGLYQITLATTTTLIPIHGSRGSVKSVSICNNHASVDADVDLYLHDSSNAASYIIHDMKIPAGVTLLLNESLSFDNSVLGLKMVTTGTGLPLSVIIK